MSDCKTCKHSKFMEDWGEWKCMLKKRKFIKTGDIAECSEYKSKNKEEKKK